jgi:nucleoside-diphosphate-sugar epimerase
MLEVFSPSHTRSFCFIEDAIELLVRIMERDSCVGKTLNLGTAGPEISMSSLAELMTEVAGKELVINGGSYHTGSPSRRCPDMSLTESLTGYTERMSLPEALGVTYDWYRRNVFEN